MSNFASLVDAPETIDLDGARISIRKTAVSSPLLCPWASLMQIPAQLWLSRMPSIGPARHGGANISVTVDQKPSSTTPFAPARLHVLRTTGEAGTSLSLSPEGDAHHAWDPLPASVSPEDAERTAHATGDAFIVRPPGFTVGDSSPEIAAWRGPIWDDGSHFVVVLEFPDGQVLRSSVGQLMTAC